MFIAAFVLGLFASLHCLAMCGPIAITLSVSLKNGWRKNVQFSLYHIGRLISYMTIGLLFGLFGKGLYLAGFQQRLSILAGVVMLGMALISYLDKKHLLEFRLYREFLLFVQSGLGKYIGSKQALRFFMTGIFNGFLPCGMVYSALVGALATANVYQGSFFMLVFGLGTLPLFSLVLMFGSKRKVSRVNRFIPLMQVVLGLMFVLRGLGLGIDYLSPSGVNLLVSNVVKACGY